MPLEKLSPIHFAISTIEQTIADLERRKRELLAQLPPSEHTCRLVPIIDPRKAGAAASNKPRRRTKTN